MSQPTPQQLAFRNALLETFRKHGAEMDASELLAVASHFVGQLIALQDQRRFTSATVMELVTRNVEQGNQDAINSLMNTGGVMQ
jgi:hypothetical protein